MSVHYKFKSSKEFDTIPVDGINISLGDLKEAIIEQKRLGRGQPYDLQVTNAETKEVYTDEKTLIQKNSSLVVSRIPIDPTLMKKPWEVNKDAAALLLSNPANLMNTEDAAEAAIIERKIQEATDLTKLDASEEDKINAMMAQSTLDYHPSRYVKLRNSSMSGAAPPGFKCYKCHQTGHWQDLRKSSGIPSKFLVEVNNPNVPGAMITPNGKFVVFRKSLVSDEMDGKKLAPYEHIATPEELVCSLCKEMLRNAVLIPCCASAFCDECITNYLLDSEDHTCPSCRENNIGPDTLIPNRYLRLKCIQFDNQCYHDFLASKVSAPSPAAVHSRASSPKSIHNSPYRDSPVCRIHSPSRTFESISEDSKDISADLEENTVSVLNEISSVSPSQKDMSPQIKSPATSLTKDIKGSTPLIKSSPAATLIKDAIESIEIDVTEEPHANPEETKRKHNKKKKKKGNKDDPDATTDKKKAHRKKKRLSQCSSSSDKALDTKENESPTKNTELYEASLIQFDPKIPPPDTTFSRSDPVSDIYSHLPPQLSSHISTVTGSHSSVSYPHYSPRYDASRYALVDDPLTKFQDYLRERDRKRKKENRYSRSRSRSRSHLRSVSRSPNNSHSRNRKGYRFSRSPVRARHGSRTPEPLIRGDHSRRHKSPSPLYSSEKSPTLSDKYASRYHERKFRSEYPATYPEHSSQWSSQPYGYADTRYTDGAYRKGHDRIRRSYPDSYSKTNLPVPSEESDMRYVIENMRSRHKGNSHNVYDKRLGYEDVSRQARGRHSSNLENPKTIGITRKVEMVPRKRGSSKEWVDIDSSHQREKKRKLHSSHKENREKTKIRVEPSLSPHNISIPEKEQLSEIQERNFDQGDLDGGNGEHIEEEHRKKERRKSPNVYSDSKSLPADVIMEEISTEIPPVIDFNFKEKKKREKKKRKKEKRRNSQASTEGSQLDDDVTDKKKKKKKEKRKKNKLAYLSESDINFSSQPHSELFEDRPVENSPRLMSPNSPAVRMPALSKWELEDDVPIVSSQGGNSISDVPEQEVVTSDVIKKAESVIYQKAFGGRVLGSRRLLDSSGRNSSPLSHAIMFPEHVEVREAKRKGPSIQITVSSKTESQIGQKKPPSVQSKDSSKKDEAGTLSDVPSEETAKYETLDEDISNVTHSTKESCVSESNADGVCEISVDLTPEGFQDDGNEEYCSLSEKAKEYSGEITPENFKSSTLEVSQSDTKSLLKISPKESIKNAMYIENDNYRFSTEDKVSKRRELEEGEISCSEVPGSSSSSSNSSSSSSDSERVRKRSKKKRKKKKKKYVNDSSSDEHHQKKKKYKKKKKKKDKKKSKLE